MLSLGGTEVDTLITTLPTWKKPLLPEKGFMARSDDIEPIPEYCLEKFPLLADETISQEGSQ